MKHRSDRSKGRRDRKDRHNGLNDHNGRNGDNGQDRGVGRKTSERASFIAEFTSGANAPRAHGRNGNLEHQAVDRGERPPTKKLTDFYYEDTGTFSDS